jgi:hypothetical protein
MKPAIAHVITTKAAAQLIIAHRRRIKHRLQKLPAELAPAIAKATTEERCVEILRAGFVKALRELAEADDGGDA